MQDAYIELHRRGHAHSVEVWDGDELVGGLYGLAMGQLFFGESMFSLADNASKFGFATLVRHLKDSGFVLIDCQMPTDHLHSLAHAPFLAVNLPAIWPGTWTKPTPPPGFAERLSPVWLTLIQKHYPEG